MKEQGERPMTLSSVDIMMFRKGLGEIRDALLGLTQEVTRVAAILTVAYEPKQTYEVDGASILREQTLRMPPDRILSCRACCEPFKAGDAYYRCHHGLLCYGCIPCDDCDDEINKPTGMVQG